MSFVNALASSKKSSGEFYSPISDLLIMQTSNFSIQLWSEVKLNLVEEVMRIKSMLTQIFKRQGI